MGLRRLTSKPAACWPCRFDIHGIGVVDLTPDAAVLHVLLPLPAGCGCAGIASRQAAAFHIWRKRALSGGSAASRPRRRRLFEMPQHVAGQHGAQLQGHITFGALPPLNRCRSHSLFPNRALTSISMLWLLQRRERPQHQCASMCCRSPWTLDCCAALLTPLPGSMAASRTKRTGSCRSSSRPR